MEELLTLLAEFAPLRPEQIADVRGYTSTTPGRPGQPAPSGLDVYLRDHPQGFLQLLEETKAPGDLPYLRNVNVKLTVVHATQAGAEALAERVQEAGEGVWMAETGWRMTERTVENDFRAVFVYMTFNTQTPLY